jgi:pimeloyl-ACP methyl ester carboxylesterase
MGKNQQIFTSLSSTITVSIIANKLIQKIRKIIRRNATMNNRARCCHTNDLKEVIATIESSVLILMTALIVIAGIAPKNTWARLSSTIAINSNQAAVIKSKASVLDQVRNKTCYKIDKRSGQLIPCAKPARSTGYLPVQEEDQIEVEPKAFDYFDAEYSEDDFHDDNESVIPYAYLLSQLAAISYKTEEQANDFAEKMGLNIIGPIEAQFSSFLDSGGVGGESKAYIFYNDDTVFIAFQGSNGWLDWEESNLDFWGYAKPEWGQTEHQVCYIIGCYTYYTDIVSMHNGFYDAMDIIFDEIMAEILPLLPNKKLWITGHSLGGAIATLTAFRLEFDHNIPVQGVHVFGAPAVGDSDWENVFENTMSNVHRWNLEGDPAPVITQAPMFYHVGIINNLYSDDSIVLNAADSEMLGYIPHCGFLYGVNVTHMNYWKRMHEELNRFFPDLALEFPDSLPSPSDTCYQ